MKSISSKIQAEDFIITKADKDNSILCLNKVLFEEKRQDALKKNGYHRNTKRSNKTFHTFHKRNQRRATFLRTPSTHRMGEEETNSNECSSSKNLRID
ncbi:hypothetical protein HHI36_019574 [Cryptolaemus montrouzieri]|uniref:Uncharacterized protein n=1 Tax=Cryptolaemus montrouzieri TaxID=559131 RepID=A0ABD2N8W0_9CUCU